MPAASNGSGSLSDQISSVASILVPMDLAPPELSPAEAQRLTRRQLVRDERGRHERAPPHDRMQRRRNRRLQS